MSNSDYVTRIARAIVDHIIAKSTDMTGEFARDGRLYVYSDGGIDAEAIAVAALLAAQEPDEAMIEAGAKASGRDATFAFALTRKEVAAIFRAMIKRALET